MDVSMEKRAGPLETDCLLPLASKNPRRQRPPQRRSPLAVWSRRFALIVLCLTGPFVMLYTLSVLMPTHSIHSNPLSHAFQSNPIHVDGVGHFSEWSISQKNKFLADVNKDPTNAAKWVIVMGNEGGDLDSMTSALLWAYHLTHNATTASSSSSGKAPSEPELPIQAVALLQTPFDALDLRPENKLALANAKMSPGHSDLLTVDELPMKPAQIAPLLHGLALVDHPRPRSMWAQGRILTLFDHHTDRGDAPDAHPRIIERTASCATLIANYMLEERDQMKEPYHVSHELLEMALSAIALDSDGLTASITTHLDYSTASKLFDLAPGYHEPGQEESLPDVMKRLSKTLKKAKKDLDSLSVRDLLRRDWKGDVVHTSSDTVPDVHLGFASIPYSLRDMAEAKTKSESVQEWFSIESHWTEEIRADISVALTSYKVDAPPEHAESDKIKQREIILVVRSDHRIDEEQADHLFRHIVDAVESAPNLDVVRWKAQKSSEKLEGRQMVWTHNTADGGRKIVRPIVENAVRSWAM
ncbi:hypothetical protein OC861_000543 [Tilletia horrida]|nr:hypothetical protein OC861_000543 [Tilletia horrida]